MIVNHKPIYLSYRRYMYITLKFIVHKLFHEESDSCWSQKSPGPHCLSISLLCYHVVHVYTGTCMFLPSLLFNPPHGPPPNITPFPTPLATSPPIQPLLLSLDQRQMSPIASANNSNELCVLWWYLGSTVETFVDKDAVELEPLNISGRAMPASSSGPSLAIMVFID